MKTLHRPKSFQILAFLILLFSSIHEKSLAQVTVTFGTGTSTSTSSPVQSYYNFNYSQQLYTASEISLGGASSGQMITSIAYYWSGTGNLTNCNIWDVYLGNTTQTSFTTSSWVPLSNMTLAYSGPVTLPSSAGWVTIPLSSPVLYSGNNVVVAIDENVSGYGTAAYWRYTTGSVNTNIYYYSDGTNPNPSSPPTATGANKNRPNMQMVFANASPCSGTPSPGNTFAS